ncbi:hypothetical protein [Variovorax fucosicus]|uniref:hypothetical protein n=1 Tax=Variovorax fucosicus TaxID=3053517 RepID=UPI002577E7A6|nr:hypothetical protein [Variovorax sp. J22G47]MDM0058939.1 hypothetical protein [Variovorax sp. J22G47]
MPSALRTAVLGTRTSSETKARFAALAAQQGLTESALLALLIDKVVAGNATSDAIDSAHRIPERECTSDRLTLRLRPGDRTLADAKAAARCMKTSSYLAMLVRTHVRGAPVMPPAELDELKGVVGHLAALGRQLRSMGDAAPALGGMTSATAYPLLVEVGTTVESVRQAVAGVVRTNLMSWETGNA